MTYEAEWKHKVLSGILNLLLLFLNYKTILPIVTHFIRYEDSSITSKVPLQGQLNFKDKKKRKRRRKVKHTWYRYIDDNYNIWQQKWRFVSLANRDDKSLQIRSIITSELTNIKDILFTWKSWLHRCILICQYFSIFVNYTRNTCNH